MGYQTIDVAPLAGAMGAEIHGVDLASELTNQQFDEIHQAHLDYLTIVFRDQKLTPPQQADFARRFGKLEIYPFIKAIDGAPEVVEIIKTEDDAENFGGSWHSDTTYQEEPVMGSMLYALEVPKAGGDTLYANMYLAYESLSDGMKEMLDGLRAHNNSAQLYRGGRAKKMKNLAGMKDQYNAESEVLESLHPVVRTHPETGRKALYVNRSHTERFENMTMEESAPLLHFLCDHATRPEFTCRVKWEPGTLTFWDNRCTQHFAINDYQGKRRRMHRVIIEGDRPV